MSAFDIRIIAIITMIIGHTGLYFFPEVLFLRVIGRLSFPLFAWLIASGAYHTRSMSTYLKRMLIFAVISQPLYFLANQHVNVDGGLNIIFTLFIGLAAISMIKTTTDKKLWVVVTALCASIAQLIDVDYGAFGVISTVFFYVFFNNLRILAISQTILFILPIFLISIHYPNNSLYQHFITIVQPFGLLSLLIIALYNNTGGPKTKYLFYIFYPLHYVVILIIQNLFS